MKRLKVATEISLTIAIALAFCGAQAGPQGIVPGNTSAQSASPADPLRDKAAPEFGGQRYPRYELRADDVVDLFFEFTPEFNQTLTVQPDGYITLRGVGDVHVAGLTVPEITETIRTAYGKILNNPTIAIALKDFDKPYFTAGGAIGRPGKYELRGDTTVVEAITIAGGFSDTAKHSQVVLYRRVSRDWMEGRVLNVKKMLNDKSLSEDLHLKPGDMVFVPQSLISKIRRFVPVPSMGMSVSGPIP
jgi:polysaccharide export outer membrane protein